MVTIYFSGTGNTKFIAKRFSKIMNCESYSIEEDINFKELIIKNDTIALCYPIHFSKAPIFFMDFVSKFKNEFRGKKVIILCSQQFYSGDGARSIVDLLDNVDVIYAEHFNMQNNITSIPLYYKITKRNNEKCLKNTDIKINKVISNIKKGNIKKKGFNNFSIQLGKLQHLSDESVKKKQLQAVKITDQCIVCNKCVKNCPTQNLFNDNNSINFKENCTFCFRCVNICPKQAITVLLHGKVKEQYYIMDNDKESEK